MMNATQLRLCLASELFYPVYAGPAVRFSRYLPGFRAHGLDVRVFCGTPSAVKTDMSGIENDWDQYSVGEFLPETSVNGVPVSSVKLPESGSLRRDILFSRTLAGFCQNGYRPDVIQLLSLPLVSVPWILRLRAAKVPIVYTKTMLANLSENPIKRAIQPHYWNLPAQFVDCVVVSSSVMRDTLQELGLRTRIDVIPNGVDVDRFRPAETREERSRLRRLLGIDIEDDVILFVGPTTPRKGIDVVLEAWVQIAPEYPNAHLVVVGPRRDEVDPSYQAFNKTLNRLIAASGARDRVHFVGFADNVEDYMRMANLFVFPSRREGMPNVVPEAMASGVPVIMTPFTGLPVEFGRPDEHYMLVERDADLLSRRVMALLANRDRRDALGRAGRKWITRTMDVDISIEQYVTLYRELSHTYRKGVT